MTQMRIDLLDPGSFSQGQPHDQFRWLREHAPVFRHPEPEGPGFLAVTRYEDVRAVGRDPATFSSVPTTMIPDPVEGFGFGDHQMMLMSDPPHHTRLRRTINRQFTPRAAERLRLRVRELARRIVDAVVDRGECDSVTDVAGEMPSFVIADLLGLPLAGTEIAAGDKVVMYYGSANRDERAFPEPDRFDVGRQPNDHVAFGGGGPHFCLGAHLARIEIHELLHEVLTRMPDLELARPAAWLPSNFISGPKHLPVMFTPEFMA